MAEYIERETLMAALCKEIIGDGDYYNGEDDMQDEIRDMVSHFPAADVAPVVHGRWVSNGIPDSMLSKCTVCGYSCGAYSFRYCPNCGAKMDLRGDETQKED